MPSASFTTNAVVVAQTQNRHYHDRDHQGVLPDTSIVLSATLGSVTAGSSLHDALVYLNSLVTATARTPATPPSLPQRARHDRLNDHSGTLDDDNVTLATSVGAYPAGATLAAILAAIEARALL